MLLAIRRNNLFVFIQRVSSMGIACFTTSSGGNSFRAGLKTESTKLLYKRANESDSLAM